MQQNHEYKFITSIPTDKISIPLNKLIGNKKAAFGGSVDRFEEKNERIADLIMNKFNNIKLPKINN